MKSKTVAVTILMTALLAGPAFAQQGDTKTTCTTVVDELQCTTTHVPTPEETQAKYRDLFSFPKRNPAPAAAPAPPQPSPEAIKVADERAEKHTLAVVNYVYCRQHKDETVNDFNGQPKTCAQVIEYTKTYCTTDPSESVCKLARSRAEVEKSFADLTEDFRTDPRRNKKDAQMWYEAEFARRIKWGCMSYPDMILPKWGGGTCACPDAPEPSAQTK